MASNSSNLMILKRPDFSTIHDKFLVGYQGWFTCPEDGEPVGPGHHGWLHWFNYPIPDGGRPNTDVWPDVSSYSPSELFPAPGLKTKSGEQTFLFSSRNPQTVRRHFHWMAQHGVDGAFLQRFAGQCDLESGNEGIRRIRDEVGERVREAAEQEGRVFAIMYDVSGVPPDRIQRILEHDWAHLVHNLRILDSPNYLREKGKPVIALWGFGFDNAGHTPALVRAITHSFRDTTPGGIYIMGGAPAHWRTAESDADRNPGFLDVWLNEFDAISPWTIGRYRTEQEADHFAETKMKGDMALIKKRNEESTIRKIDYIPVVLPGGSGYNLSEGKWGFNDIKREGGRFLWRQIYNARHLGVRTIYGAMWDEYDEGTAFMPIVEHKRNLPESDKYSFLALDVDGYDVPSDWYMRICGFAAEGLRNERRILETFPVKELQDYWSSRPRYEAVDPKSNKSMSGSSLTSSSARSDDDAGAGGQTYQEWLALQNEEKDEVPPPPYTLELDEPTDPTPSQTEANPDTRATAVAAPLGVPSVEVQSAPVVVNVQPVTSSSHAVVSQPAVIHTAPASQNQAYSQVGAQSPQPYPPSGTVQHPQSPPPTQAHSPRPYPPSSALQHPQSQATTQAQLPQPYRPAAGQSTPSTSTQHPQSYLPPQTQTHHQPYPPGQSYYQYATTQGYHHPVTGQSNESYLPSGGAQSPQPYGHHQGQSPHAHSPVWGPPAGGSAYQGYPASTGHASGYPPAGAPSQGYIPPNAQSQQSYSTSGGPVRPGYSPANGSSFQSYTSNHNSPHSGHNQLQDPVATLVNDFGRQSISGPIGGSGVPPGGNLATPPPLHPTHHGNSGYHTSLPPRPSTNQARPPAQSRPSGPPPGGRSSTPPPLHPAHSGHSGHAHAGHHTHHPSRPPTIQARPPSQSGHHPAAVSSPPSHTALSLPVQETSAPPTASTQNRPKWPPAEWDLDTPPVQQLFSSPGHKPSTASGLGGANLTRPQSLSTSGHSPSGGSALRPTSSMSNKPPSRPNTTSNTNTPPGQYSPPIAASTYNSAANTHDHSTNYASSPYLSTGPPTHGQHGQHGPPVSFPSGPQYGPSMPSSYPGQQGASMYNSGSTYASAPISPPHGSNIAFPTGQLVHSGHGSGMYPGGPSFPSSSSTAFPQAHGGDGGYYGAQGYGSGSSPGFPPSGPYSQSPSAPWMSSGPPMPPQFPGPSMSYSSSNGPQSSGSAALGFALDAVENIADRGSKLFSKLTK